MLDGLLAVPWSDLNHAYGNASDIPELIAGLTSDDPDVWVEAVGSLYDTLCHQQCTVYPATAAAVPFLLELLATPHVCCRGKILEFLAHAVRAGSLLAKRGRSVDDSAGESHEQFNQKAREELEAVRGTRAAIWRGIDLYCTLAEASSDAVRMAVPYLLGGLIDSACDDLPVPLERNEVDARIAGLLSQRLDLETNDRIRGSVAFGLSRLVSRKPEIRDRLEALLERPSRPDSPAMNALRLSAAFCLAEGASPPHPRALEVLTEALLTSETTDRVFQEDSFSIEGKHAPLFKAYRKLGMPLHESAGAGSENEDVGEEEDCRFPWISEKPTSRILACLVSAGAGSLGVAFPKALRMLDDLNPHCCDSVARPILQIVFGTRRISPTTTQTDLSPDQIEVLRRIYGNPLLWATSLGDMRLMFESFGLSEDRSDWARLLGVIETERSVEEIEHDLDRIVSLQNAFPRGGPIRTITLRQIATGSFLVRLKRFPELEFVDLCGAPIGDSDVPALADLPLLSRLELPHTPLTDVGVRDLAGISRLISLNLSGTSISDAGLLALRTLTGLKSLNLIGTGVSAGAVAAFIEAVPGCKIRR